MPLDSTPNQPGIMNVDVSWYPCVGHQCFGIFTADGGETTMAKCTIEILEKVKQEPITKLEGRMWALYKWRERADGQGQIKMPGAST